MEEAQENGGITHIHEVHSLTALICKPPHVFFALPSLLLTSCRKVHRRTSSAIHASLHMSQQFMQPASSSTNKQRHFSKLCHCSSEKAMQAARPAGPLSLQLVFQPSFREDRLQFFSTNQAVSRIQALCFHAVALTTLVKEAIQGETDTQHVPGSTGV